MIDHVVRAHLTYPFDALRPRCGGNHREAGMPRQLDRDGAHAASAADDQQMPAAIARTVEGKRHALEQQLPCGQGGQRQRGRLREAQ